MTLQSDFNEFLTEQGLESNVTPQVLNEIERYARLANKSEKIVDVYKAAVERIFSDNSHLLPHAQDLFEQVFDKYAGTNPKIAAVKDGILADAQSKSSTTETSVDSSFIDEIKNAILANDMPTGEKPIFESFMENANKYVEEGSITLDDLIEIVDFALKNDVKVGQENKPAMEFVLEWERENGNEGLFLRTAIENKYKIDGMTAIKWAVKNDVEIDGKPAFVYAVEDLGQNQDKILEWAVKNDVEINGKLAFLHAFENKYKIDGMTAIKWAVKNDVEIDGKPAFVYAVEDLGQNQDRLLEWAVKNDVEINGKPALQLAVKADIEIDGKPAFLYAVEDLGKNEEKILKYAVKNDLTIGGKSALEWAFMNDKTIGGKPVMDFATTNNVNVGGASVMDWVDKNADRLISAKEGNNRETVGRHTERINQTATAQTVRVR